MIVSSLVVTLSPDVDDRLHARAVLDGDGRLTLGDPIDDRVPVVAETDTAQDGEALCDALAASRGVVRVDVVAIDYSLESEECVP